MGCLKSAKGVLKKIVYKSLSRLTPSDSGLQYPLVHKNLYRQTAPALEVLVILLYPIQPKRVAVHGAIMCLMIVIAVQGRAAGRLDGTPLLYAIAADEIIQGPLDSTAHAQEGSPGIGGARLAAIESTLAPSAPEAVDSISFDDPEVAATAGLTAANVIAPTTPTGQDSITPSPERTEDNASNRPSLYAVQSGDTVASIAATFNLKPSTILGANGLESTDIIKVGDRLTILPTDGVLYTVRSGDTVSELATTYKGTASEIIAFNGLGDDASLKIGAKIIIPGGELPVTTRLAVEPSAPTDSTEPTPTSEPVTGEGWQWPTISRHISQYFGGRHTGVDIDNRSRPPIVAANSGTVQFAGWFGGYGKLVILNHGNGLQTYYGHMQKIYVASGQAVTKGERVGQMGSTGHSTGPHVHFELRRNGRPINPLGLF